MRVDTPGPGALAPAFTLAGLDGKKHSLADALRQGPVLLAFFKESCPVCQFTFPFVERIYRGVNTQGGVHIWGISQDDKRDSEAFRKECGLTFPVLLDGKGYPVSNAYGLTNVPTLFLVKPDGTVSVTCVGFDKKLMEAIASSLAERAGRSLVLFTPEDNVPDYNPG